MTSVSFYVHYLTPLPRGQFSIYTTYINIIQLSKKFLTNKSSHRFLGEQILEGDSANFGEAKLGILIKKISDQSTFGIIKAQNTQLSFVNGFMELSSDEANRSERNQTEVGVFKRLAVKPLQ